MALGVLVDGTPMPEADARALWERFSAWMEEHKGDLRGFAETEGFASVHPELHAGEPVLVASKTAPQKAYTSAVAKRAHAPGPAARSPRSPRPNRGGRRR
jgi:hypothetical protein